MWVMRVELGPSDLAEVGFNMLIYFTYSVFMVLKISFALIFFLRGVCTYGDQRLVLRILVVSTLFFFWSVSLTELRGCLFD